MDKKEFFNRYEIIGMCRHSLKLAKKGTNEVVYISRNAFNLICSGKVKEIRETRLIDLRGLWIEVCVWTSI